MAIDYDGGNLLGGFFFELCWAWRFLFTLLGLYCTFCLGMDERESKIGGGGGKAWGGKWVGMGIYDLE
jgi:hypothetical protein